MREKILQSCLITVIATGIFELFSFVFTSEHLQSWTIVTSTSVASTAFILFTLPHSAAAKYRTVIGGHLAGALAGSSAILLASCIPLHQSGIYACSIGLSLLLMTISRTMHPPAAGTALTMAMVHAGSLEESTFVLSRIAIVVFTTVVLLIFGHYLLRHWLANLE